MKNLKLYEDFSNESTESETLNKLYNGIMNDGSIQRYTMGWKDVVAGIKKKLKKIAKTKDDFENFLVADALKACTDDKLKSTILSFAKELDMNLDTFGKRNPSKR